MTKNDLVNGMIVEQRNGDRKLVVGDMLIGEDDWGMLDDHRDDLISKDSEYDIGFEEFDIVKVYELIHNIGTLGRLLSKDNFGNLRDSDCIWTRNKTEEEKANISNTVIKTIEDITNGMIVETREGVRYLVLGDLSIGENSWLALSDYNDSISLNHRNYKELDIVKIYNPDEELGGQRLPRNNFINLSEEYLVWSESEVSEALKTQGRMSLDKLLSKIDDMSQKDIESIIELEESITMK